MNVVTGSAGFIGSHLVERLPDVHGIDRLTGPAIEDPESWCDGEVEAIYHLASPVGPVGVLHEAGRIVSQVVDCARIMARWALEHDCPLIYVSTSEVYGSGSTDKEDDPCLFGPETSARKEYAVAKLAAETMLRNTRRLDVRIVRPFNVAGPRQKADGGFVIPRFIAQARTGQPLTVYQPGTQRRAFGHVLDIVDGIVAVGEIGRPGEVYNLGNPRNTVSMTRLADLVLDVMGLSGRIEIVDPVTLHGRHFREAPQKLPNIQKAVIDLDWYPTRSLTDIIADAALSVEARAA